MGSIVTPLDRALFLLLVLHDIEVQSRPTYFESPTGKWVSPDISDIHGRTRETIKSFISGELTPEAWLDVYDVSE